MNSDNNTTEVVYEGRPEEWNEDTDAPTGILTSDTKDDVLPSSELSKEDCHRIMKALGCSVAALHTMFGENFRNPTVAMRLQVSIAEHYDTMLKVRELMVRQWGAEVMEQVWEHDRAALGEMRG